MDRLLYQEKLQRKMLVRKFFELLDKEQMNRAWGAAVINLNESTLSRWKSRKSAPHRFICVRIQNALKEIPTLAKQERDKLEKAGK